MARIANNKRQLVLKALAVIENDIHSANGKLKDEQNIDNKFDSTYVAGLDTGAKNDVKHAVQVFRWLIEVEFGLTPPPAFDDTDIDGIDPDIRTHDDGIEA